MMLLCDGGAAHLDRNDGSEENSCHLFPEKMKEGFYEDE
jgi:hypothetical protein